MKVIVRPLVTHYEGHRCNTCWVLLSMRIDGHIWMSFPLSCDAYYYVKEEKQEGTCGSCKVLSDRHDSRMLFTLGVAQVWSGGGMTSQVWSSETWFKSGAVSHGSSLVNDLWCPLILIWFNWLYYFCCRLTRGNCSRSEAFLFSCLPSCLLVYLLVFKIL